MNSVSAIAGTTRSPKLALMVALASVLTFATASVVAAVGYPSWMWLFVFLGLVATPPALVVSLGYAAFQRFARS